MSLQQGPLDLRELAGSVAVVTGCANRGIGWGLCKQCAEMGMSVALVDLHQHMVDAAAAELAELYPDTRCAAIQCDVGDAASVVACRDAVLAGLPGAPIGAVFANAGVIFNKTILRSRIEDFELTLRVNVVGVVNTIQAFVPVLQQQGTPSVMCSTASVGGISRGDGGGAAYQGSKAAVVSISETLSFELARRSPQVRVHVLW
jgi:NAD(P)-dependent dehydrogenase (short-subunit alcohol dehydrogenase family)